MAATQSVLSDDDFLKRTGAAVEGAATGPEDDDAFLTRTGAKPKIPTIIVKPSADQAVDTELPGGLKSSAGRLPVPTELPRGTAGLDREMPTLAGNLPSDAPGVPGPFMPALSRIGSAVAEGYRNTPPLLTPEARTALEQSGPIGNYLLSPVAQIGGAVVGGFGALGSGIGQTMVEGANAAGAPALGRDLNMLAVVAPAAPMGLLHPSLPQAPMMPVTKYVSEHYAPLPVPGATTLDRINQLIAHDNAEIAGIGPEVQPNVLAVGSDGRPMSAEQQAAAANAGSPQGQGQSVGAAGTPASQSQMTLRQELVNRAQAETEKLNELQPAGRDLNRYIDGVDPTMAQMEQSVKTAREQKALSTISPEISDQARAVETAHIAARKAHFDQVAGSKTQVDSLKLDRSEQAERDTAAAFKPGQVADTQPVVGTISDILNAPRAKENTALQQYIAPIMSRLYEADGTTLKTDPAQLYGLREDLERMRSKPSQAKDQNLIHVSGELKDIRDALDKAIEGGAPGYRTYMDNYANASRRIDELEVLQGHENGLNGFKTYTPFKTMMRTIVEARQKPGNNPYKSISDDTMSQLWNLRDDLRRAASADDLARARGSDTLQNAVDVAKTIAKTGVRAAMHYGLYHATGDLGSNAILGLADMLNNQRLQAKTVRRAHEMLNPNPLSYPPPNAGP